jgi:Flp pilus assembly protein TadG
MIRALARRLRAEDGQMLPLATTAVFVVLVAIAGLAIDVSHAYSVKRKLQATADAAALAAAIDLPDVAKAQATAVAYGPAGKNSVAGAVQARAVPWCLKSIAYCYGSAPGTSPTNGQANGLVITERQDVATSFLSLIGINSIPVTAKATACGVCGATKLDVVLVLDRTGSMSGDVSSLTSSVEGFLNSLNPSLDRVGLVVLPPGPSCSASRGGAYPFQTTQFLFWTIPMYAYAGAYTSQYLSVPLTTDFQNPSSGVYQAVSCLAAGGPTSYLGALQAAYAELQADGRSDAQKAIVFESDGAANDADESAYDSSSGKQFTVGGSRITFYKPSDTTQVLQPCQSAVDYANGTLKPANILVYTVAYGVSDPGGDHTCYASPYLKSSGTSYVDYRQSGAEEAHPASWYLSQMATATADAYDASKLQPGDLAASFQQIAAKLAGSSLMPDSEASGS